MSESRTPKSGEIYRHFKNKLYQVLTIAKHSETGEELVIYQALYGTFGTYARPLEMFVDAVDHIKYPDARQKYRFELQKACDLPQIIDEDQESNFISAEKHCKVFTLFDFLDAETYKEKIQIFKMMRADINEKTINDIAASLDIVVNEGDADERCQSILNCLNTMARFETDRLR